jgi:ubiquinone/menaquinone biosynthesis C-methylase UbiE
MSFYGDRILPHLIHASMKQDIFAAYRRRVVAQAHGRVLELGIGSGLNLPFYTTEARHVVGLDPSERLLAMARTRQPGSSVRARFISGTAEALALADDSIDTVITTWTLCTIPDVLTALREARRVLRSSGTLLFVEHGASPDPQVRRWQDRLTPLWRRFSGGCHLNRSVPDLLEDAGFRIVRLQTGYMKGPRPMTFMYEGRAQRTRD